MLKKIQNRIISPASSLLDAMKCMDRAGVKTLFVFRGEGFEGIFTIGDIQRAIIAGKPLTTLVGEVLDPDKIYCYQSEGEERLREKMKRLRAECMPILNEAGELVDVRFWKETFLEPEQRQRDPLGLPVVIMAGGEGKRLRPLTHVIPKPLVPIGEKTILEEILDRFVAVGCGPFYLSLGYKADLLKYYLSGKDYDLRYFEEDKPLGTIGSVSLLRGTLDKPFFVSNCDILIDQDFAAVYDYHLANSNDITIITALKSFRIPYGVVEAGENGLMTALQEKPEHTFMINTGVYLLQPELIREIPQGRHFDVTELMERVRARGGKVGCFPVSEKAWTDMGDWDEYLKIVRP